MMSTSRVTRCGIAPCAWGTSKEFEDYVTKAGLDADRFIQNVAPSVSLNEVSINVDLVTFDKPQFIKALLDRANVNTNSPLNPEKYDRVIDATGAWRAFLPPLQRDLHVHGVQYLGASRKTHWKRESLLSRSAMPGVFHLSNGRYHIGCACLNENPRAHSWRSLGWLSDR